MTHDASSRHVVHETLTFQRIYDTSPTQVFAAFADVERRARWSAPSPNTIIVYSKSDFAVGGADESRCGAASDPQYAVRTHYHDIVQDRRIVFTEAVSTLGELLAVSLITWELIAVRGGTKVVVTDQLTAIDGADMVSGTRFGMTAALDNLARELRS
jgi:uncharacterized protein YndB with AHSA1/START domain